ncbi:hypothetical protein QWT87_19945 [Chryseobacterium sp. APV1]|uniref:Uncharacterized protein n=1 Tax=Chryseobacterium urinae TaxID=3058400 RepID=A0ABT8U7W1_9FLAO|nr:hypothetical protein [Chryseobacterium sp. APV1]MDO3427155.1 hypothetical protein [Chryseobacterium sp. APV1]
MASNKLGKTSGKLWRFKTELFVINGEVLWFPANCWGLPENSGDLKQSCL